MSRDADLRVIADRAEVALVELGDLERGPMFRILHRCGKTEGCGPGEEIWAVLLVYRGREFPVPFGLALLLVFDYLARTRHVPQRASQIAAGLRSLEFYKRHGANAKLEQRRKFSRAAVKEYVKRIRRTLYRTFNEANLPLDAGRVLCSEETEGNEVVYRLRAKVEWAHVANNIPRC